VAGGGDINPNNNNASDPTNVRPPPDLTITKSHAGNFMQGQSSATYSITVSNVGGTPTVGSVSITDNIPVGLSPISASGTGWTCSFVGKTLNCARSDSLNSGASYPPITLTVAIAADAPASIPNLVTVSGGSELNTTNNSATDTTTVNASPDLTITKTHSGSFIQGQSGTYAITVSNLGPVPSSGAITITDPFPVSLTPTSASGSGWACSIANQTVTCSRSDVLPAGQSFPPVSVGASIASNAPAQVTNPATVSGGSDVTPANNTATDTTPIVGGPDLTIAKVHNGTFVQGQPGSYTLTVSNVGQSPSIGALNVALDAVPAGLTPTSATGPGWTCSITGQVVACRRDDPLNPGAAFPPVTLSVNVSATAVGNLVNIAAVSGGGDVNPNNNTSTDTAPIAGGPDLTVTKTHTGNFRQGQQGAAYTLVVSNAGASPTSGPVTINDTVPAGLTPVSAAGSGWTCTVAGQGVDCTRPDPLAGGGQYPPVTITVNVAPNAPASVTNVVTVSGGGEVNPNDNTANDPTTITPEPDLTITKTHAASFTQGQTGATYTITVSNPGSGPSSGAVTVTDTLPAGLTPTAAVGTGWTCNPPSGQTVTCTRSDALAAGASYPVITLSVNVANNAASSLTNTVTVSGGGDVDPGNNTATDNTTVGGGPDLTVTKTHAQDFRQGEQGATYSIVVKNSGLAPTTGQVTVRDTVPAGMTPVVAAGAGWSCGAPAGQTVTCTRSDALAAGQSYEPITLTVNVAINAASSVTNSVTVSGGGDVNPGNDTDTDVTPVTPQPDLTVSKSHAGNFFQGQQGATYTLAVSNVGAAASAGPVTVSDNLPAGLTPTAASGPGWSCSVNGQAATCTRSDPIAGSSGDYPPITITANVASGAPTALTNTVTVAGGGDANPANNTASDPTTISPGPDLTVTKSHSGNFRQGQTGALYTILVKNIGVAATAGTVTFQDNAPTGLTITAASGTGWTCTVAGTSATCTRADALAAGQSFPPVSLTVDVRPDAPASVTNNVIAGGGGDVNPSNNTAADPTVIAAAPDLTVTKTHVGNFVQGQVGAVFTIVAKNVGQEATSGVVTLTDSLPAGLVATAASGTGWTCSVTNQSVTCTRSNSIGPGASFPPVSLVVDVAANAPSTLTNVATISGGGNVNNSNDTATDTVTIGSAPDLTITKTHVGTGFATGQRDATYNIAVKNVGPSPTAGIVSVQDTLPAGLNLLTAAGPGWSCTTTGALVSCSRSDPLAANGSYPVITVTASVASDAPPQIANTAVVSGGGDVSPANNSSTDTVSVARGADLLITKSHTGNFTQGQTGATYTLTVKNQGGSPTNGTVTVTDELPVGLNPGAVTGSGWTCTLGTRTAVCTRSDPLAAGSSYPPITFTVNVAPDAANNTTNKATVSGGGEVNAANNTASDPTVITGTPDLTITKIHFGDFIASQPGLYLLNVHNRGSGPTTAPVAVTDAVPPSMTPVSAKGNGWTCSITGQNVACNRSDPLAAGKSYPEIALTVNIALTAPRLVTNTANVTGGGELTTSNNSVSNAAVITTPNFTLQIVKQADQQSVQIGDVVTYEVIVTNPSKIPVPTSELADQPPPSFKYVKGTAYVASGGTRHFVEPQVNGSGLVFPMGPLAPESSVSVFYRMRIGANAGLGTHLNSAVASGTLFRGLVVHSTTASARVKVESGAFTTSQFVIGRVFEDVNRNGVFDKGDRPVAGSRLFLSNGQSVITDSEGLYNIPSVGEGAVVISLDPVTLPKGYALLDTGFRADESWTRLLRTPLGSGGMLRQNFALTRTGAAGEAEKPAESGRNAALSHPGGTPKPRGPVERLEVETDRKELIADGRDSTLIHVKAFDVNNQPAVDGRVMIQVSSGRLVGIETCDPGSTSKDCTSEVNRPLQEPSRLFQGPSVSAATTAPDGTTQTVPMQPQGLAHFGQTLLGSGSEPVGGLAAEQVSQNMQQQAVLLRNGEAEIRLLSESNTGKTQILVKSDKIEGTGEVFFVPPKRTTILVGLAQLSIGKAAPESDLFRNNDTTHEYAKFFFETPFFSDKNLLTAAYDSNRPINRTTQQDRLFQQDPLENVYPVFGDSSTRYQTAQSNSHLFVRLDRGLSNLMFGDLRGDTSTSFHPDDSFTSYQRSLTGIQLHLQDKAGSYLNAKGARPETAFGRDVLSGDFFVFAHLTRPDILPGSENIVLETRDRRNPEIILSRETLTRSVDYNIDWTLGSIFFLRRISTLDPALNLIQIVVTYEFFVRGVSASVYDITGEKQFSRLGLRLGGSFVNQHQDDFGDFYLGGIHGQQQTWNKGVFRFEVATSQGKFSGGAGTFNYTGSLDTNVLSEHDGFAYRASWEQPLGFASSVLELKALKTDDSFLNPFGPTTVPGSRQESAELKTRPAKGAELTFGFLDERNSTFGFNNQRETISAFWNQRLIAHLKLIVGYDFRKFDDNQSGRQIDSNLFVAGLGWEPNKTLKAAIRREQNATTSDPTYPNETVLSASYKISEAARFFYTQRISSAPIIPISDIAGTGLGALNSTNETSVGIETKWSQYTSFGTRYQIENGMNGTDSYAILGLVNRLPVNKTLTLDSGFEHALHLTGNDKSYDSASIGMSWLPTKKFRASTRYELRDQTGFGSIFSVGAAGKVTESITTLARFQWSRDGYLGSKNVILDGTAAFAIRPLKSDRVGLLFNYTVRNFDSAGTGLSPFTPTGIGTLPFQGGTVYQPASPVFGTQNQFVQVLSSDGFWQPAKRLELFGRVATSDRSSSLPGEATVSTFTYLVQGRVQYRFARLFDAATEVKWMVQPVTDTHQYTTGTELGVWALPDLRVGLGYNWRSNIDYGVEFLDRSIHRGFYFTLTSKMSKIFDLFGTPREGLQTTATSNGAQPASK
jgi:uncharacterized repeat protein (TIGR01451 family)